MSPQEQEELADLIGRIVDARLEARTAKAAPPVLNGFAFVTPVFSASSEGTNDATASGKERERMQAETQENLHRLLAHIEGEEGLRDALRHITEVVETAHSDQSKAAAEITGVNEALQELLQHHREKAAQTDGPQEANLRGLSQMLTEERAQRAASDARLIELARTAAECLRQMDARILHEDGETKGMLTELREGLVGQFSNKGLAAIVPQPGDRFDPTLHKSVNGTITSGVIQQLVQPGYQWDSKAIYKAEVIVTAV